MSEIIVDCKGLSCPEPILKTKKALAELPPGAWLTVIVDNPAAKENVTLFAANAGYNVTLDENKGFFTLTIKKVALKDIKIEEKNETGAKSAGDRPGQEKASQITYLIISDCLGQGSPDLGHVLMKSFFIALTAQQTPPETLIFMNTGVYLSIQGSSVIEYLEKLTAKGATVLVCGTCLDYYKIKEKLRAGRISNMYEINEHLTKAQKVITIS